MPGVWLYLIFFVFHRFNWYQTHAWFERFRCFLVNSYSLTSYKRFCEDLILGKELSYFHKRNLHWSTFSGPMKPNLKKQSKLLIPIFTSTGSSQWRNLAAYRQLSQRESSSQTLTGCPISDVTWSGRSDS